MPRTVYGRHIPMLSCSIHTVLYDHGQVPRVGYTIGDVIDGGQTDRGLPPSVDSSGERDTKSYRSSVAAAKGYM